MTLQSFYINRNGRAQQWDRDHCRLELARWVFHHPEVLYGLVTQFMDAGIDFFKPNPEDVNYTILFEGLNSLTNSEIDAITGVNLDGTS